MSVKNDQKPVFEISKKTLNARFKEVLDKTLKSQAHKNLPLVYRNKFCIKKNQFIHEYSRGRKLLIQQNRKNSEETIIREF